MSKQTWKGYADAWSSHDVEPIASFLTHDCSCEDVALGVVNRHSRASRVGEPRRLR